MPAKSSEDPPSLLRRIASAPISWGVCEVPGWGAELPRERVLAEMRDLGLAGTELGSPGFLPTQPETLSALLEEYVLDLVGGFVPLVLHDSFQYEESTRIAGDAARLLAECGGEIFVTAVVASFSWEPRRTLAGSEWNSLVDGLHMIEDITHSYGLVQAVHPHLGTLIETGDDIRRLLDTTDVGWCVDTGHLAIGGFEPLRFVHEAPDRIRHVHLKDVRMEIAARVLSGDMSLMQGVQHGMFCPMGDGDIPIAEIVAALEDEVGYSGWYVIEQDAALTGDLPAEGDGPVIDVARSLEYISTISS